MIDEVQVAAAEEGDACSGGAACADGPAVGRQAADERLEADGHKVGQSESPIKFLVGGSALLRIFDHRQGHSHALIAAAGVDDDGHFTPGHTRIRTGGGTGSGAHAHVIGAIAVQQNAPHARTPASGQAFLGNGRVAFDLAAQHGFDVCNVAGTGEIIDALNGQQRFVFVGVQRFSGQFLSLDHPPVALDVHHIGVPVGDAGGRAVTAAFHFNQDIKQTRIRLHVHADDPPLQISVDGRQLLGCNGCDHLQFLRRIACDDARSACRVNALASAGIGHGDGFGIFDDVAAHQAAHPLRHAAQRLPGNGSGISDRNGLGAAHCRTEMILQHLNISRIARIRLLHFGTLPNMIRISSHYHALRQLSSD